MMPTFDRGLYPTGQRLPSENASYVSNSTRKSRCDLVLQSPLPYALRLDKPTESEPLAHSIVVLAPLSLHHNGAGLGPTKQVSLCLKVDRKVSDHSNDITHSEIVHSPIPHSVLFL